MRVLLLLGEDNPSHALNHQVPAQHSHSTEPSPGMLKRVRLSEETPHSHLQTSLINHQDRETQTGAEGIDTGWHMLRAPEPRDIPRQSGHSPWHSVRHRAGSGAKGFKAHPRTGIKALLKTPPVPSHRWGNWQW